MEWMEWKNVEIRTSKGMITGNLIFNGGNIILLKKENLKELTARKSKVLGEAFLEDTGTAVEAVLVAAGTAAVKFAAEAVTGQDFHHVKMENSAAKAFVTTMDKVEAEKYPLEDLKTIAVKTIRTLSKKGTCVTVDTGWGRKYPFVFKKEKHATQFYEEVGKYI